jgi:hypothetical protein
VSQSGQIAIGAPHIFFTPRPRQGGYEDPSYDQFTQWNQLWDDYTWIIGSQVVASRARQILVIPFYKSSQAENLGSFLTNWKEVISAVITAAANSIAPQFLHNTYGFDKVFSSSFSSGIVTHQNFNTDGTGVTSMTRAAFDLDGKVGHSIYHPIRGVIYQNTRPPHGVNPVE